MLNTNQNISHMNNMDVWLEKQMIRWSVSSNFSWYSFIIRNTSTSTVTEIVVKFERAIYNHTRATTSYKSDTDSYLL